MTVRELHALLCSRSYYDRDSRQKYRFKDNSLYIDRKAAVAFAIHEENGVFYMGAIGGVPESEELLRIETGHPDGNAFHFYGKHSGQEILVLE